MVDSPDALPTWGSLMRFPPAEVVGGHVAWYTVSVSIVHYLFGYIYFLPLSKFLLPSAIGVRSRLPKIWHLLRTRKVEPQLPTEYHLPAKNLHGLFSELNTVKLGMRKSTR